MSKEASEAQTVFDLWNDQPVLRTHRDFSMSRFAAVHGAIERHGYDNVCAAIRNLNEAVASPAMWYSWRGFTLERFLSDQHMPRFIDRKAVAKLYTKSGGASTPSDLHDERGKDAW